MSAAGRSFGPYEVVAPIGAGGMGEVFKARDRRLDRIVALKTSREQFSDRFAREARAADARTDIFAFGLVLYEMLSGKRAFVGDNAASVISAIMTAEPPPLPQTASVAPAAIERIIRQCLAKDPDERWQAAADVKRAIDL